MMRDFSDSVDWRRQGQESYLQGRELKFRTYLSYRPGWDHDHCEFCGKKFSVVEDDDLKSGYTTDDNYHWICEACFADFCDEFEWKVT